MSATTPSPAENNRNKTHKRAAAPSAEESITKILDAGAESAYRRPWHRLERGLRLNRIRAFTQTEQEKMSLTQYETASLLMLLQKALDKRQLNSKMNVIYDQDTEKILEIKGLVMHRTADGVMKFQILEKKVGTVRRKREDGAATAAAAATAAGGGAGTSE